MQHFLIYSLLTDVPGYNGQFFVIRVESNLFLERVAFHFRGSEGAFHFSSYRSKKGPVLRKNIFGHRSFIMEGFEILYMVKTYTQLITGR